MAKIEDAASVQELGDAVQALANTSFDSYQKVGISFFETMTGAKPFDADECGANFQVFLGTLAKDFSTMNLAFQKAIQIVTPP